MGHDRERKKKERAFLKSQQKLKKKGFLHKRKDGTTSFKQS